MTYNDRFVAELKLDGKILRIKDDTAYLPFGSEYSLLLKNLNTRRVSVNIEIDGQDVLDNQSLMIEPNKTTELMGFLKGHTAKNKFKFIQKTSTFVDYQEIWLKPTEPPKIKLGRGQKVILKEGLVGGKQGENIRITGTLGFELKGRTNFAEPVVVASEIKRLE